MRQRLIAIVVLATSAGTWAPAAQQLERPQSVGSLTFAVIGDSGTGKQPQYDVAERMIAARAASPFEFVIMVGDNMYGSQAPDDFITKFERPYTALLKAGVPFYAALGNHDNQSNRFYKGFNMGGERHYTFVRQHVRFFMLDTNLMNGAQLGWLEEVLSQSQDAWKIAVFHHPLYSDGARHGSDLELRVVLEPLLVRYGVNVVFSGHEHFYERTIPQKGITYFIEGSSGQLRKGNARPSPMTAAAFDQDYTFMLVDIVGDRMSFQAITRTGRVVDSGVIHRRPAT
jgi:3',5'-cyclic AMP phosphodiesterase CpdA